MKNVYSKNEPRRFLNVFKIHHFKNLMFVLRYFQKEKINFKIYMRIAFKVNRT